MHLTDAEIALLNELIRKPIICRWCGLPIPDDGECEAEHEWFGDLLEMIERLPESEREQLSNVHTRSVQAHKSRWCHCPDRARTLFSSTPQPHDLDWHDKHDG